LEKQRRQKQKDPVKSVRNFIEDNLKIQTKEGSLIPFKLNFTQDYIMSIFELIWSANLPLRAIILKARQHGVTTLAQGIGMENTSQHKYKTAKTVSYSDGSVLNIYSMSDRFYRHLPENLKPAQRYYTKKSLVFQDVTNLENSLDSRIIVDTAKNLFSGRSETIQFLHVSEMAMMDRAKPLMLSLMNAVPKKPKTTVIIESTARGNDSYFKDVWDTASSLEDVLEGKTLSSGKTNYIKIFIPWFWNVEYSMDVPKDFRLTVVDTPDYGNEREIMEEFGLTLNQMVWRRDTILNECGKDLQLFHQEYPASPEEAFIASGRLRFNTASLKKMAGATNKWKWKGNLLVVETALQAEEHYGVAEPVIDFEEDDYGNLSIWRKPDIKDEYVIGVDVAEGIEVVPGESKDTDWSVASVFRRNPFEKVAMYRSREVPEVFSNEVYRLGFWYNYAWLVIEKNKDGNAVLANLRDIYSMLFYKIELDQKTNKKTKKFGWDTNLVTKPIMISDLAGMIMTGNIIIPCDLTIKEYLNYIIDARGKTRAKYGKHDDIVMADALALQGHFLMPMVDHNAKPLIVRRFGKKR